MSNQKKIRRARLLQKRGERINIELNHGYDFPCLRGPYREMTNIRDPLKVKKVPAEKF